MSATSVDREAKRSEGQLKAFQIASATTIYKGSLVGLNSSGLLVSMSDTASLVFAGVAAEGVVNPSGGTKKCRVYREGEFEFAYAGGDASVAKVGSRAYAQDNQTVDEDTSLTTNDYPVGIIVEAVSATKVRVDIGAVLAPAAGIATGNIDNAAVTTAKIADANVTAAKLTATMQVGYIPLPLTSFRLEASNDVPALAAVGGVLASDSAPALARVNGATDKQLRVVWAASGVVPIFTQFAYPPDLDDAAPIVVNLLMGMAGAADTPVVAVGYFEGVGDTNAGGNTSALAAAVAQKTVSIAHGDVGAYPKAATVVITPGAHGTDAVWLYSAWITYTRK